MIFELPPPDPELQAKMEEIRQREIGLQIGQRRMILHWAGMFCTCTRWYDPEIIAPQSGCAVHGGVLIRPDGKGWL